MKHLVAAILSAIAFATVAQNDKMTVSATASLRDGSSVKGEFHAPRIAGSTVFMEKLELNPAIVKSLIFSGTNGEAKVELLNGDAFAMTIVNESFAIKSILGELSIPRRNFRSIFLAARKTPPAGEQDGLLFYCTFDNEAAVTSPAVGPSVKMELGQIKNDGKNGGALFVPPGVAGAQIKLSGGTLGAEGCIEFWAKMAGGKTEFTTGGDPRFFIICNANGGDLAHLEFASNNGCGNSGLGGHLCQLRTQTNTGCSYLMPYSDVFKGENYNGWHHYAFAWTATDLSVFLDGKKICHSHGETNAETAFRETVTLDIPLNRQTGRSPNNKSPFLMDELKIWNFAKQEFDIN